MRLKLSKPGYWVSGGLHLVALILLLVTLPKADDFDPMQETVPIETVSDTEFNQVMHGDKAAEKVVPDAAQAEQATQAPAPPTPEVQKAPPPPPPPPPVAEQTPEPPVRPVTPPPPTPPAKPVVAPAPTPPTPPERVVDAEAEPLPAKVVPTPPRPPERVAEAKPQPPIRPKPVPKPLPKVQPPKVDQLAKLLDQDTEEKPAEKPQPKVPAKPQPEAAAQEHSFDLTDISRLLTGATAPPAKASSGQGQTRVASLGSPTAHSNKMAPSLWGQLDGLMEEQYRQCWSYLGLTSGQKYIPQIKVTYDESGGLTADPVLVNPPSDPALRSLAESAMRAVRRCNPLRIPTQYAPYYDEWKGRVLRFDPQEMAG